MPSNTQHDTLYLDVEQRIRRAIRSGHYRPGHKLPQERQLARQMQVSRTTLRQALDRLSDANLVQRLQGRGTYIAGRSLSQRTYLCLVVVGYAARHHPYTTVVVPQAEQAARLEGWRLYVQYASTSIEAARIVEDLDQDAGVVGGLLTGDVQMPQIIQSIGSAQIPWAMIGDFNTDQRLKPMMDQAIGDTYQLVDMATRRLLSQGVKRAALFVHGDEKVWSRESISAFRSVLDSASIPAEHQQIVVIPPSETMHLHNSLQYQKRDQIIIDQFVNRCQKQNRWPQGMILTGGSACMVRALDGVMSKRRDVRQHLAKVHIMIEGHEEHMRLAPMLSHYCQTQWAVVKLADVVKQAVVRLAERREDPTRPPVRDYIRIMRITDANEMGSENLADLGESPEIRIIDGRDASLVGGGHAVT